LPETRPENFDTGFGSKTEDYKPSKSSQPFWYHDAGNPINQLQHIGDTAVYTQASSLKI
jgi:hypothetical protein